MNGHVHPIFAGILNSFAPMTDMERMNDLRIAHANVIRASRVKGLSMDEAVWIVKAVLNGIRPDQGFDREVEMLAEWCSEVEEDQPVVQDIPRQFAQLDRPIDRP